MTPDAGRGAVRAIERETEFAVSGQVRAGGPEGAGIVARQAAPLLHPRAGGGDAAAVRVLVTAGAGDLRNPEHEPHLPGL